MTSRESQKGKKKRTFKVQLEFSEKNQLCAAIVTRHAALSLEQEQSLSWKDQKVEITF